MLWKILISVSTLLGQQQSGNPTEQSWETSNPASEQIFIPSASGPQTPADAEEASKALYGEHFGGDMVFPEGWNASDAGIRDTRYRWPGYPGGGVVPFELDSSFSAIERSLIITSILMFHISTCIRFVERTNETDFIRIIKGDGCWSYVGRMGGMQQLSMGDGCMYVGTGIHELGHAIGLHHEHQRSDRDDYIIVLEQWIIEGESNNFNRTDPSEELIFTEYDYNSIMHYGSFAFSKKPGVLPTMVTKDLKFLTDPFNKPGFTNSDVASIKKLYQC